MAYEPKPGDGVLFQNEKKSDKAPDRTGYVLAHRDIKAGEKLNLAGWIKEGAKGKFLSIRMSDVRARADEEPAPRPNSKGAETSDDRDIPF